MNNDPADGRKRNTQALAAALSLLAASLGVSTAAQAQGEYQGYHADQLKQSDQQKISNQNKASYQNKASNQNKASYQNKFSIQNKASNQNKSSYQNKAYQGPTHGE